MDGTDLIHLQHNVAREIKSGMEVVLQQVNYGGTSDYLIPKFKTAIERRMRFVNMQLEVETQNACSISCHFETKRDGLRLKVRLEDRIVPTSTDIANDILVKDSKGNYLFTIDDGKDEITEMTVKQLYSKGIQWFEPTANNYMPMIDMNIHIEKHDGIKHFTWGEIMEFAEEDRWMISYRSGGSGDWKNSEKGADGYYLSEVEGELYWSDALGQIPFVVDKFTDELKATGSKSEAKIRTINAAKRFGDGNIFSPKGDYSNSYDNAMIERAINWAEKRYEVTVKSKWYESGKYQIKKTNHSPEKLATPSHESQ